MSLIDAILGRRLASDEAGGQRIGAAAGVPTFGLDALSSAAYGPEAALTVLLPLGAAGLTFILPITVAIAILLGIIYISYRQTIAAYPNGGGSYTVARANLGDVYKRQIDYLPFSDFKLEAMRERVLRLNPHIEIFEISAKTGQGVDQWAAWLSREASSFIGSASGASQPRIGKFLNASRC